MSEKDNCIAEDALRIMEAHSKDFRRPPWSIKKTNVACDFTSGGGWHPLFECLSTDVA
ncbi:MULTISPECIES: hypothetical protein [unclassified Phaeobacter]|uniref:hypothetical protein n=1 Tax=unclassified Phaeobacter TaxID=2621772 RepID=UPI003A88612B